MAGTLVLQERNNVRTGSDAGTKESLQFCLGSRNIDDLHTRVTFWWVESCDWPRTRLTCRKSLFENHCSLAPGQHRILCSMSCKPQEMRVNTETAIDGTLILIGRWAPLTVFLGTTVLIRKRIENGLLLVHLESLFSIFCGIPEVTMIIELLNTSTQVCWNSFWDLDARWASCSLLLSLSWVGAIESCGGITAYKVSWVDYKGIFVAHAKKFGNFLCRSHGWLWCSGRSDMG